MGIKDLGIILIVIHEAERHLSAVMKLTNGDCTICMGMLVNGAWIGIPITVKIQ